MTYTWIICGGLGITAGWLYASMRYYRKKWKELKGQYTERCAELTDALGEVGKLSAQNKSKQETITNLICACKYGQDNLRIEIWECPDEYPLYHPSYVSVVGAYKEDQGWYFTLKEFNFDKNDPSDREFAIRRAEELIEIIQTI